MKFDLINLQLIIDIAALAVVAIMGVIMIYNLVRYKRRKNQENK